MNRIALGTAQFGLAYGATNSAGQVRPEEVAAILKPAWQAGIRWLDTAPAYGDAEEVLGRLVPATGSFRIVTKTLPIPGGKITSEAVSGVGCAIDASRRRLGRERLDGLLVHHGINLLSPGGDRLIDLLLNAKISGACEKIGVSVYDPHELFEILDVFTPDLVQLPFNLLDQRFAQSGLLAILKKAGVEIHARSPFLQGTLLVDPDELPSRLKGFAPQFRVVDRFIKRHALSRLEACVGFGLAYGELDALVVGVTNVGELNAIVAATKSGTSQFPDAAELASADEELVNPGKWPYVG